MHVIVVLAVTLAFTALPYRPPAGVQTVMPGPASAGQTVTVMPGQSVLLARPSLRVPGASYQVTVTNQSGQPATVRDDGRDIILTVTAGFAIQAEMIYEGLGAGREACPVVPGAPNVARCTVLELRATSATVWFTADANPWTDAALNLSDPRPCIPPPGQRTCDAERAALWGGDPAAWARRGVADLDAIFGETIVFRVQAGDPATISAIARILGTPYLKVTHVRFVNDEFVEVTNLGGGPQDLSAWTVRSPARGGIVSSFPPRLLQPGEVCTIYTGPARTNPAGVCQAFTGTRRNPPGGWWPDDHGEVVLYDDALHLVGDVTRYSADPADQPPPPYLQLLPWEVQAPGSVLLPPFAGVRFRYVLPCPTPVPGYPPPSCGGRGPRDLLVTNSSSQPARVTFDIGLLTVVLPEGFVVQIVDPYPPLCTSPPGQPNVLSCTGISRTVTFTAAPA